MVTKTINTQYKMIALLGVIIILSGGVFAFGVRSMYIENNPLTIYPGEIKDIKFILESDEEVKVLVQIEEGADIARLIDGEEYVIPADGIKDVNLRVNMPDTANIGTDREIKLSIIGVDEENGGMVGFKKGYKKTIPVLVVQKPAEEGKDETNAATYIAIILGILILLVVISIILKNKKKGKKKK